MNRQHGGARLREYEPISLPATCCAVFCFVLLCVAESQLEFLGQVQLLGRVGSLREASQFRAKDKTKSEYRRKFRRKERRALPTDHVHKLLAESDGYTCRAADAAAA